MISIFDDDDSYVNLSSLSAVFNQLNFSKINVGEAVKEVKWRLEICGYGLRSSWLKCNSSLSDLRMS
uniref:Uncharacterized protein n=1 Tax=Ditylenchus dipsaci TaxID=166011 RepID=A0A915DS00_9BILA